MIGEHRVERAVLHVPAGGGETLDVLGDAITYKVTSAQTDGQMTVAELTIAPGGGPPGLHTHPPAEVFYVLEGEFAFQGGGPRGGETFKACAGSVVYVAAEVPHNLKNVGQTPGRLLAVYLSPLMESFSRAIAASVASTGGHPEPASLRPIFERYQVRMVT